MPRILLIGTGGTISALSSHSRDWHNYATGTFTARQLVEQIPEAAAAAELDVEQLDNFSSTDLTPTHWLRLRELVLAKLEEFDGVVITHGTSTLEETAWFLHLTLPTDKPVVLVGAQRPLAALGSDAAVNLLHAVQTAAARQSRGRGVLAVMNGEIHGAREVRKAHTYRVNTLDSGAAGVLGWVDVDGSVQYGRTPVRRHTAASEFARLDFSALAADAEAKAPLPRVAILYSYPGGEGDLIEAAVAAGYDGLVIAAMGAGMLSRQEEKALRRAAKAGVAVVRGSRTGAGRVVVLKRYADTPFIAADDLSPAKARLLLMLALAAGKKPAEIQRAFDEY